MHWARLFLPKVPQVGKPQARQVVVPAPEWVLVDRPARITPVWALQPVRKSANKSKYRPKIKFERAYTP
ncbi:MAG: hypothetical protein CO066_02395 [Comamonadaceae bacterium CG_4_9_14_0_8_um_filter_60_18]|nr:MAG: hypothetical protein COW39_16030 [Comamonadaceae bacterium CG17_big_fil_post_rev_8_21_14_2_50_60_13]PIY25343.1 MAG: hypothetical protein COZ10_05225 [Comamonadaceae bacterium CG_4_10_14_3_um_filter_60_75]PJC16883.1 MAG: hypothetical protein CO066_02395 [Comamonadaceae bacterium CG_4_9_14_0_8_um_filter_60_18]